MGYDRSAGARANTAFLLYIDNSRFDDLAAIAAATGGTVLDMNPTALLKIFAALSPLMGDKDVGAQMVREVLAVFEAMQRAADAAESNNELLDSIDKRLAGIEEKMQHFKLPLSEPETQRLLRYMPNGEVIL